MTRSPGRLRTDRWAAALAALAILSCGARGEGKAEGRANRLIHESSPYLLLHAHNPVDWYPWSGEAFEAARKEGKPIFLSVGYSSCYWCHVMEREVFSNPAIADLMNRWFVNVKVDREERPEIDEIYMTAAQLLTEGGGGWPNSVFLTPDLEPFFAGTYFPPEDREGQSGFPTILRQIHEAWTGRRAEVDAAADRLAAALRASSALRSAPAATVPGAAVALRAVADLAGRYDAQSGGFDGAPKFPRPGALWLLWGAGERGDPRARDMVLGTLRALGRGAIYDQLDGGFHRYTLDRAWRVPHFEKMLYDNALLADMLVVAAQAARDPELERLARGTLDFVLARMTLPSGAFASAIDAETDGEEGAYYVWSDAELRKVLGPEGFAALAPVFALDAPANLPKGRRTLYLTGPLGERERSLRPWLDRLRTARRARKPPRLDDKALTDWNGMMIAALARGGRALGEPRYGAAAARAADFILKNLRAPDGTLLHSWRQGQAKIPAFLDDYAWLLHGLLALHESTGDPRWLREAGRLADEMESRLRDPRGGYFLSPAQPSLLFQPKTVADSAVPSGNAVAVLDLLTLAERTGREEHRRRAEDALRAFAPDLDREPAAFPTLALAVLRAGTRPSS
jgi:uncharacterized protein YyaL (SSP411 family)